MLNGRLSRRDALKLGGLSLAMLAFPMASESRAETAQFVLPPLPYPANALDPVIGSQTMTVHHDKHHQAYVDNLNRALQSQTQYADWSLEDLLGRLDELPEPLRTAVRNNAGGHHNHTLFWSSMQPLNRAEGLAPDERLGQAIIDSFGSVKAFEARFQEAGSGIFGSGWVWLAFEKPTGKLAVVTTPNQDSLLMGDRYVPLLGNDVWEHAYYLSYQNRRADYLKAWWNVVNWATVSQRYHLATQQP